jgi:hypothetical protein
MQTDEPFHAKNAKNAKKKLIKMGQRYMLHQTEGMFPAVRMIALAGATSVSPM